jgi:rhodanese-related sulfurtransferase
MFQELSPQELKYKIDTGQQICLLDVRSKAEVDICHIDGSLLIPLSELNENVHRIPQNRPIVTICHHGVRSKHAAIILMSAGVKDVHNLTGGIAAWAESVDPSMATY